MNAATPTPMGEGDPMAEVHGDYPHLPPEMLAPTRPVGRRHRYAAGDPDPTDDGDAFGSFCDAVVPRTEGINAFCTWPPGHGHPQHVAGDGDSVLAVRDVVTVVGAGS